MSTHPSGKAILVTGGTGGIGLATATALVGAGAEVIVSGRSRESAEAAVQRLGARASYVLGDLSTREGVDAIARQVADRHARLDVLIHNAGLMASRVERTVDGIESGFAVNVAAPLRLTHALLPQLRAAGRARVIALTGGEHPSRVELDNLEGERSFVALTQYSHHKLVMMGVMRELARRLDGPTVNVCYPGQAATRMTQGVTAADMPWLMRPFAPLFRLMTRDDGGASAAKASRSSVHLATAPELEGVTERYFDKNARERPWPKALDDATTRDALFRRASRAAGHDDAAW